VCSAIPLGGQKFLSEFDVSIPGFIECRPVEIPDWELFPLKALKVLLDIFRVIRSFP